MSALPDLKDRLLAPHLFPLWRRIETRAVLTGVQREEVAPFLSHIFSPPQVERFSADALAILFEQGRGIPALIGSLAGQCLKASPEEKLTVAIVSAILEQLAMA